MPITERTLNTRLDGLAGRFAPVAAELRIKIASQVGGAVALRRAIYDRTSGGAIVLPTADQLDDITNLLTSTPASVGAKNVGVSVFEPRTPNLMLQTLQRDVADGIVTGIVGLGASFGRGQDLRTQIEVLLNTVLSVDDTSRAVREILSGRRASSVREIPRDLLDNLERLQASGCFAGVRDAMVGLAGAIAGETPTFVRGQRIDAVEPNDACAGDAVRVTGVGFGASQDGQEVIFTGAHRSAAVVAEVIRGPRHWSDTAIDVIVPIGAGRGPIAVAKPGVGGAGTVASAAGELAGQMAACFGQAATGAVGRLMEMTAVPTVQPPRLNHNFFGGGPPEISSFELRGRTSNTIWPGGSLALHWKVEGATEIAITPQQVGSEANELPQIPGRQNPVAGTYTVANIPGSSKWTGAYKLVASNKCGKHEAVVEVAMARRLGLALSGGGSRGAFQLGVLDYLYSVRRIRPDAISSTSVGSVNALQLVMGDLPGKHAVEQLKETWLGLQEQSNMWEEEPWLQAVKQATRDAVHSIGWWDLAFFPLTIPAHFVHIQSKLRGIEGAVNSARAFFNLSPIETKMLQLFDQARVDNSGIAARFIAVSLKTGEIVKVDEKGHVLASGGGTSTLIKAAMASSIMPGIFPAERVGEHFCVDGGIREIIPVQYCIDDLGANVVYAIACSARTTKDPRQNWTMLDVMTRSMMGINFDEVVEDDIAPHGGWPEGVVVHTIFPRFNIFDAIMVEPGLIRIAMDYGWMCAADELDTFDNGKGTARLAADKIVELRLQNWADRYTIEGAMSAPDPNSGFVPAITNGFMPPSRPRPSEIRPATSWFMAFVQGVRDRCRQIRAVAAERLAAGGALPPTSASWWQEWEAVPTAAQSNIPFWAFDTPWKGMSGQIAAETPPATLSSRQFDVRFYLNLYADLRHAFGPNNHMAAARHWLNQGLPTEGRRGSREFDVQFYLSQNPDLQSAFGSNYSAAVDHWLNQGLPNEGRRGSREFDVQFYLSHYPDLRSAFGTNYTAAADHWLNHGLQHEGRRASLEFDVQYYLATYADVRTAFGSDYSAAFDHWVHTGMSQGRRGVL